jgi:hypothetical protein
LDADGAAGAGAADELVGSAGVDGVAVAGGGTAGGVAREGSTASGGAGVGVAGSLTPAHPAPSTAAKNAEAIARSRPENSVGIRA